MNVSATTEAQNVANAVTKNYSDSCGYAKNTTFALQYSAIGDLTGKAVTWFDLINDTGNSATPDALGGLQEVSILT